jgi:hypothetical protein
MLKSRVLFHHTAVESIPMIDKAESRRIRVAIRHALMEFWDPCGVKGVPQAYDEYDAYLGDVFALLIEGAPDEKIADYLLRVEKGRMGLTEAGGTIPATVAALRTIPLPPASA